MRPLILLVALAVATPLVAQETPTEREAARDVLAKMAALESSLNVPALVARLTAPNPARDAVAARAKELMDKDLLALGDSITKHPEHGFVEFKSIKLLTDYLKAHDFDVTMGTPGLSTAFVARYRKSNGAPNLGVIVEYDALRGTKGDFHGDQHSTQGPIGIAAAIAMAEYLTRTKTPGTVVVFGAPGEEMMPPNAKTVMYDAGVFNGMDVLVRSHSTSATTRAAPGFGTCCMNNRWREIHLLRRAGTSAHGVEWTQCARGSDPSLQQHRRHPEQSPARGAHPGRDHRGRRGA